MGVCDSAAQIRPLQAGPMVVGAMCAEGWGVTCNCHKCRMPIIERIIANPTQGREIIAGAGFAFGKFMDLVVCPDCGSKRCPTPRTTRWFA